MWARSGRAARLASAIASAGRMALTVYLLETVISTAYFYHWGLGMFDQLPRVQRLGFVVVVYTLLVMLSVQWLKRFRMGPMEWVWRSVTYWRVQRIGTGQTMDNGQWTVDIRSVHPAHLSVL